MGISGGAETRLTVQNRMSDLPRVTEWIRRWAEEHGLPAGTVDRLDLCSTELVTNVIDHAYADSAEHDIALRLELAEDCLTLEIEDDGRPFDPCAAHAPRPPVGRDDGAVGGWGVALVRKFSDGMRYERGNGRNRVTLIYRHRV
jgi:serine/threonine-protein kinase RsbW